MELSILRVRNSGHPKFSDYEVTKITIEDGPKAAILQRNNTGQWTRPGQQLAANEETIVTELNDAQGSTVDIGGYYHPDPQKVAAAMRPSGTLNGILASREIGKIVQTYKNGTV